MSMSKRTRLINATGQVLYARVIALMIAHGYDEATGFTKKEAQMAVDWWNDRVPAVHGQDVQAEMTADGLWITYKEISK